MPPTRAVLPFCLILSVLSTTAVRAQVFEAVPDTLSSTTTGLTFRADQMLLPNDSVLPEDSLQLHIVSGPIHGSLVKQSDGSFTYTPAPGFVGEDRFVYRWQTVPLQHLAVDPAVSILSFTAELQTSLGTANDAEDIPVQGTIVAHLGDTSSSVDSVHVLGVELTNRGDHSLRFEYGSPISVASLRIQVDSSDVGISLLAPGSTSAASGIVKAWQQTDNLVDISVTATLQGGGLLTNVVPAETQQLQTQTSEDLSGSVFVNGEQLLMILNVASSNTFDLDGNSVALDIAGSLQATGSFVPSRQSNEAEVVINVVSGAGREALTRPVVALGVYPNPSAGVFNLRWEGPPGSYRLSVFDALGRRVHGEEAEIQPASDEMRRTLDASNWSSGVYFVRVDVTGHTGAAASRTHLIVRQ